MFTNLFRSGLFSAAQLFVHGRLEILQLVYKRRKNKEKHFDWKEYWEEHSTAALLGTPIQSLINTSDLSSHGSNLLHLGL